MTTALTRRQKQLLQHLSRGGRIDACYTGGDPHDMQNWEFSIFHADDNTIEGCSPSARALIEMKFVKFPIPDALGYHFLIAT